MKNTLDEKNTDVDQATDSKNVCDVHRNEEKWSKTDWSRFGVALLITAILFTLFMKLAS